MTGGATMAKAKKGAAKAKAKPNPDEMVTRALKMRQEYADWLERFATMERVSLASLFDRALATHAERAGFEAPPERIP
jgi:hypothetical protein